MYIAIALLFALAAAAAVVGGVKRGQRWRVAAGAAIGAFGLLVFWAMNLWTELLWFAELGQQRRFWIVMSTRLALMAAGGAAAWTAVYMLSRQAAAEHPALRLWPAVAAALAGAIWGWGSWETVLRFVYGGAVGSADPVFDRDVAFYLFDLRLYDSIQMLLLLVASIVFAVNVVGAALTAHQLWQAGNQVVLVPAEGGVEAPDRELATSGAVLAFVLSWRLYLARFHLLYASHGAVSGPGWTDVHVRLPAYALGIGAGVVAGAILLFPGLRWRFQQLVPPGRSARAAGLWTVGAVAVLLGGTWIVALALVPAMVQRVVVEPNELTMERPYLTHSIAHTREAFRLDDAEVRPFGAHGLLDADLAEANADLFSNVRLWDWRALKAVYQQFQEIRLYYKFNDVDIDRYRLAGNYRQVMISARELDLGNLPQQSQTFVNRHFKFTHGYGAAVSDVSEFRPDGLPVMLVKDLPAKSAYPELELRRPQIYYGELTRSYAVANSSEAEFDYPSGDTNAYIRYSGTGGVPLSSLLRKFAFGWRFGGTRLFLSEYATSASRIMFRRQIRHRLSSLAPFLELDDDPYLVVADGKLYWMVDAYTTSRYYPYSQHFSVRGMASNEGTITRYGLYTSGVRYLDGTNYLRNSVKAVVDAFDGTVRFYVFAPEDPIIRAWRAAFPSLFHDRSEMPAELLAHIRYPADMLLVQGMMYAKYHMTDPEVFYNQEDLWVRATENYYGRVLPIQPYYIMWQPPGSSALEFVLMLPFTPKARQVLIGWIAGLCDPDNYGRFIVYKFPKESRILGPQQVETKIDQDSYLSGQLSLWDQRGSSVIRGNVLAIPVGETLVYVEPIYLRAETAAYPELRLVVVMQGDHMHYGESLAAALSGLFQTQQGAGTSGLGAEDRERSTRVWVEQANTAFNGYLDALAERRFDTAASWMEKLQNALRALERITEGDLGGRRQDAAATRP